MGKNRASQNAYKGGVRPLIRQLGRLLHEHEDALEELSTKNYDSMADRLIDAALNGDFRAVQEIARAIDE